MQRMHSFSFDGLCVSGLTENCLSSIRQIGGLTVIAVGVWTVIDKLSLESLLGTNLYMSAAWILIGTGCGVIVIAFFGCLGAIRGVRCMLLTVLIDSIKYEFMM